MTTILMQTGDNQFLMSTPDVSKEAHACTHNYSTVFVYIVLLQIIFMLF